MRGDDGEANDEDEEEATIACEASQGAVVQVCSLQFDGLSAECVFECKPGSNCILLVTCVWESE